MQLESAVQAGTDTTDKQLRSPDFRVGRRLFLMTAAPTVVALFRGCQSPTPEPLVSQVSFEQPEEKLAAPPAVPTLDELKDASVLGKTFTVSDTNEKGEVWNGDVSILHERLGMNVNGREYLVKWIYLPMYNEKREVIATIPMPTALLKFKMGAVTGIHNQNNEQMQFAAGEKTSAQIPQTDFTKFCRFLDENKHQSTIRASLKGSANLDGTEYNGEFELDLEQANQPQELAKAR